MMKRVASASGLMGNMLLWAVTAALAGLLFGFDMAVISGAEQAIQSVWAADDVLHGIIISAALWGAVVGAIFGGIPSDAFGRKKTLMLIGGLYAVSAIGSALAWDPISFMVCRFLGGLGVGASSVAAPGYISEIAPAHQRGRLVALYQLFIVIGILLAYLSNYLLGAGGADDWRWMLGIEAVPAVCFFAAVLFVPESPRWLALKAGREEDARAILAAVEPTTCDDVLADIKRDSPTISYKAFFTRMYLRPILLTFLLASFNQLSGINPVVYFAPRIFELTGATQSAALLSTVGIGMVLLVFTIIAMMLIDRAGRKRLMLIGSLGYVVSLSMIAWGFYAANYQFVPFFMAAFLAAHAIGQGAVIWVYISEIFSTAARAKGQALGSGTHWVFSALITLVMPFFLSAFDPWVIFSFFAFMMLLQLIYVLTMMVETKGRSLEQVSQSLLSGSSAPDVPLSEAQKA